MSEQEDAAKPSEGSRALVLEGPRNLAFRKVELRSLMPREVHLRSIMSGVSHGTELNQYRGTWPLNSFEFDNASRVFRPRSANSSPYPVSLGYEMVSEVCEVGDDVSDLAVGDLVHTSTPHQEAAIVDVDDLPLGYPMTRLPEGMTAEQGVFISLGAVALFGVHDADIALGETVAVFGCGVVGLMVLQMVRASGGKTVIAVDPMDERRQVAQALGADATIDPTKCDEVGLEISRIAGRGGVDVSIETSGSYHALHDAVAAVGIGGRVVTMGFYQGAGAALRLGAEWHRNRPELYSSMGAWGCPHRRYPLWDQDRIKQATTEALANGTVATDGFITRRVPFHEALKEYERLDTSSSPGLKTIFTYEST